LRERATFFMGPSRVPRPPLPLHLNPETRVSANLPYPAAPFRLASPALTQPTCSILTRFLGPQSNTLFIRDASVRLYMGEASSSFSLQVFISDDELRFCGRFYVGKIMLSCGRKLLPLPIAPPFLKGQMLLLYQSCGIQFFSPILTRVPPFFLVIIIY